LPTKISEFYNLQVSFEDLYIYKFREVTKVIDLQADYFSLELNPYLTSGEREAIVKRKEELRQLSLQTKRNILVNVDVSTGTISEEKQVRQNEFMQIINFFNFNFRLIKLSR
jgi:hypothetical protein